MSEAFYLLTVNRPDGLVRIMYTNAAKQAIPDFERYLTQMVSIETVAWPSNIFISLESEKTTLPDEFVSMPLPDWLLRCVERAQRQDRAWRNRLLGISMVPFTLWSAFGHLFGYYLTPSLWNNDKPDGAKTEAGKAIMGQLFPFE